MSPDWINPDAKALMRGDDDDPYGVAEPNGETMKSPENTTKRAQDDPMSILAEAMLFGGPRAIERMERAGQQQLLASSVLPTETIGGEAAFIALGFQFGPTVDGDPLFRETTLPAGWKREGSDHDMWSYVVDERGIKRVGVFYKAAHYDRRAYMHVVNVGSDVANTALYGETPITAESLQLSRLTPDELKDFASMLDNMAGQIKKYPDIYGKYAERLAAARASGSSDRE